jgi:hypothetical protein
VEESMGNKSHKIMLRVVGGIVSLVGENHLPINRRGSMRFMTEGKRGSRFSALGNSHCRRKSGETAWLI